MANLVENNRSNLLNTRNRFLVDGLSAGIFYPTYCDWDRFVCSPSIGILDNKDVEQNT